MTSLLKIFFFLLSPLGVLAGILAFFDGEGVAGLILIGGGLVFVFFGGVLDALELMNLNLKTLISQNRRRVEHGGLLTPPKGTEM